MHASFSFGKPTPELKLENGVEMFQPAESTYKKMRREVARNLLYRRMSKPKTPRYNPIFLKLVPRLYSEEVQKTIRKFRQRRQEE